MFVCLCRVVSHRQVESAVDKGATTVEQVGKQCGAGTGCGACHEQIQDIIDDCESACSSSCGDCSMGQMPVPSAA